MARAWYVWTSKRASANGISSWSTIRCGTWIFVGAHTRRHQRGRPRDPRGRAPSKQGFLYVFDRITGKPVWPIDEKPVPEGDVREWYSPTQPFPTRPAAYSRNGVAIDELIDFTPALRDEARTLIAKYKIGTVFTPPLESKTGGPLATLTLGTASGGTNWPGGSYDPQTHTAYLYACNA
jgi:quinoprotein glucose dehydrogenase